MLSMGVASRSALAVGAVATALLFAACSGSVADADMESHAVPIAKRAVSTPFCNAVQANVDAIRPLNGLTARGSARPGELAVTVDAVRRTSQDLVTTAPDEIRADVERTVQALDMQLDALVSAGGDTAAVAKDADLAAQLTSPEVAAASQRLSVYVNKNCGRANPLTG
jgi:hypothetical protein